jgi:hypothetical protein
MKAEILGSVNAVQWHNHGDHPDVQKAYARLLFNKAGTHYMLIHPRHCKDHWIPIDPSIHAESRMEEEIDESKTFELKLDEQIYGDAKVVDFVSRALTAYGQTIDQYFPTGTIKALRPDSSIKLSTNWVVKPGDWIVDFEDGTRHVYTDANFQKRYRIVPDVTDAQLLDFISECILYEDSNGLQKGWRVGVSEVAFMPGETFREAIINRMKKAGRL